MWVGRIDGRDVEAEWDAAIEVELMKRLLNHPSNSQNTQFNQSSTQNNHTTPTKPPIQPKLTIKPKTIKGTKATIKSTHTTHILPYLTQSSPIHPFNLHPSTNPILTHLPTQSSPIHQPILHPPIPSIGYVLNVTREIDNFFPGMFKYCNVKLYDHEEAELLSHWNSTYNFITEARWGGGVASWRFWVKF